jgi:ribonuclease Z
MPIEIYGPRGLRNFVRLNLQLTYSSLVRPYVVHELLFDDDDDHPAAWKKVTGKLHPNELPGRDLRQKNGIWPNVVPAHEIGVEVSAGPILHTGTASIYLNR